MTALELCTALVRATVATSAAIGLAWLLLSAMRVSSPRVHRAAWALALAPGWLLWPWTWQIETAEPPRAISISVTLETNELALPTTASWTAADAIPADPAAARTSAAPYALAAWLAGGAVLIAASGRRYLQVARTLPLGSPPDDAWVIEWRRQLKAASVRRRVEFRTNDRLGPLVCFVPFFYLMLVPRALWSALTAPERESILRHELAHLVRGDLWKSLAIRLLALPQWFNPLAWLAVRRFDEAGEWACDDDAARAAAGGELTLANSLLRAAEFISAVPCGAAALHGGVLSRRIERLVSPRFKEDSIMKKLIVLSLLAVVAAVQLVRIERVAAKNGPTPVDAAVEADAAVEVEAPVAAPRLDPATAMKSYVIEPPDVLYIEHSVKIDGQWAGSLEARALSKAKWENHLVAADGKVDLGPFGAVYVAGMTVDEAQRAIARRIEKHEAVSEAVARVRIASSNSKVAYVILRGYGEGDNVIRFSLPYPLTPEMNLGALLREAVYPHPIDFASVNISVHRPAPQGVGGEVELLVAWDEKTGQPTAETNHPILPSDRIFITAPHFTPLAVQEFPVSELPLSTPAPEEPLRPTPVAPYAAVPATAPAPAAAPAPLAAPTALPASIPTRDYPFVGEAPVGLPPTPPTPATPAPLAPPAAPPTGPDQVVFNIIILEDRQGTLAEFKELQERGFMMGDTTTTLGALRVFEKHKLIKRTSEPRLIGEIGQEARIELGSQPVDDLNPANQGVRVGVATKRLTPSIIVFSLSASVNGRLKEVQTALDKNERQTAIMRVGPVRDESDAGGKRERVAYVVVTPEWMR